MTATYKTNGKATTKTLTEWFFGKDFVSRMTAKAKRESKMSGETAYRFFQEGTGFLTIELK